MVSSSLMDHYFFARTPSLAYALSRMAVSSYIMHPGYYSAFLMFAIVWHAFHKERFRILFNIVMTLGVLVLISRIIVLFYVLFIVFLAFRHIKLANNRLIKGTQILLLVAVCVFTLYQIPHVQVRIKNTIKNINNVEKDRDLSSSTASRRIAYEQEVYLLMQRPVLGYGLGNVTETLRNRLLEEGYSKLGGEMKAHCQYMTTWMETGLLGFVWLVLLLVLLYRQFRNEKKYAAASLVLLMSICLLTDDLLEIQANGVFFILVLNLYLNQVKPQKEEQVDAVWHYKDQSIPLFTSFSRTGTALPQCSMRSE